MAFPTTPVLDNFNRANGGLGASWLADTANAPLISSNKVLHVVNGGGGGSSGSSWSTTLGPDLEVYFTIAGTINLANSFYNMRWRWQNRSNFNDLYQIQFYDDDGTGTTLDLDITVNKSNVQTELVFTQVAHTLAVGDQIGISMIGGDIKLYLNGTQIDAVTDGTPVATAGYVAFESNDLSPILTASGIDDFGGGTLVSAAPVAAFSGVPTSGARPLSVTFTDASTNTPTSWIWYFGDGGTSTVQNPVHVYLHAGLYTVSLLATNAIGSDTEVKTNYITASATPPTADFTADFTSGVQPLTVTFTDASTYPTSWAYTFGDGGTSTSQNPAHIYVTAGTYTVVLIVTNEDGSDTKTRTNYITVALAPPTALLALLQSAARCLLSWVNHSPDATLVRIERKLGAGAYGEIVTVPANSTMYTDIGLAPGSTYTYRVRASKP